MTEKDSVDRKTKNHTMLENGSAVVRMHNLPFLNVQQRLSRRLVKLSGIIDWVITNLKKNKKMTNDFLL